MIVVTVKLEAGIFNRTARRQAFANFVGRQAKDYKNLTKTRMIRSKPAGRLYKRRSGAGFRRFHRASAPGQRPAIDTGTLLNAVSDRRVSDYSVTVFIAPRPNPRSRITADIYAERLQNKLDRPIMDHLDRAEAQRKFNRESIQMIGRLT